MQINGSGGSFVSQIYPIPKALAWQLGLLVVEELGVEVETKDEAACLLEGKIITDEKTMLFAKPIYKLFTFSVQEADAEVEIVVDVRKEQLEVYSFKSQDKETKAFFTLFNTKLKEAATYKYCPECGKAVEKGAKYCPNCGNHFVL